MLAKLLGAFTTCDVMTVLRRVITGRIGHRRALPLRWVGVSTMRSLAPSIFGPHWSEGRHDSQSRYRGCRLNQQGPLTAMTLRPAARR